MEIVVVRRGGAQTDHEPHNYSPWEGSDLERSPLKPDVPLTDYAALCNDARHHDRATHEDAAANRRGKSRRLTRTPRQALSTRTTQPQSCIYRMMDRVLVFGHDLPAQPRG